MKLNGNFGLSRSSILSGLKIAYASSATKPMYTSRESSAIICSFPLKYLTPKYLQANRNIRN